MNKNNLNNKNNSCMKEVKIFLNENHKKNKCVNKKKIKQILNAHYGLDKNSEKKEI